MFGRATITFLVSVLFYNGRKERHADDTDDDELTRAARQFDPLHNGESAVIEPSYIFTDRVRRVAPASASATSATNAAAAAAAAALASSCLLYRASGSTLSGFFRCQP